MQPPPRTSPDHRLVAPAIGAWAATACGTLMAPQLALVMTAVAVAVVAVASVGSHRPLLRALSVGIALGAASAAWHVHELRVGPIPLLASHRADVEVVARLVRDPVAVTTATGANLTVTDATATALLNGQWRTAHSPVLVLSYGDGWLGLLPGQRVDVTGKLSPPRSGDDVAAVIDARGPPTLIGRPPWWQRLAGRVRSGLRQASNGLPPNERGLLPSLVDGDVSGVSTSLKNDMRLTGLTHLMAVSGENVSIVLAVTLAVARAIGLRRRFRLTVTAVALVGFVVLARPSPSVLRAAVMGAVVLSAMAFGRRVAPLPALSAAVLFLVCVDPFLARQVGFALSVCATAALLTIAPVWTERLSRHMSKTLATVLAVPAAAQLACMPILVLAFGQLTPYAIPANLLAAPAVAPATVLGVICAVVATVCRPLAVPIAWLAAAPTAVIALVARSLAAIPGAGLRWSGGRWSDAIVVLAATAAVVVYGRSRRINRCRAILGTWPP